MFKEELKQVFFDEWEEKVDLIQQSDTYNYILRMGEEYLLDIEEILSNGEMEGLGYRIQKDNIESVTDGIYYLNCYISSVRFEIDNKIDDPLYKGFINHATEYLSLIKMENYSTDNLAGVKDYHTAKGYGRGTKFDVKKSELTIEDFIGVTSVDSSKKDGMLSYVPEEFSAFTNMFKEDYNRAKDNLKDDDGNQITLESHLESITTYGEFDSKMDKPFLEFLSVLADATIVIPLIDACLGVDIITGDNLSDFERGMKGVFAAVDTVTLMVGIKASSIAKVVGKESLKFAGKTVTINIASNGVAYLVGEAGENMDLPIPLTLLVSVAAGSITATAAGEYLFATGVGEELLSADKIIVDDLVEHLDDIDGIAYKNVTVDDFLNAVNTGKIPDVKKPTLDDKAYQAWLKKSALGKYVPPGMTAEEYEKFLKALVKVDENIALNKVDFGELLKVRNSVGGSKGGSGSSFSRNELQVALKEQGLTLDEFNKLRLTDVSKLSPDEISKIKAIRKSVPYIDTNTIIQKTIPIVDIDKYLGDNGYSTIGGYVARHDDVSHIKGYENVVESSRLDYVTSTGARPYPDGGNSYGYIKFSTKDVEKIDIPYGKLFQGTCTDSAPCTLNGFTGARNVEIIPEWTCAGEYLKPKLGAELHKVTNDIDTIVGIFDGQHFR